MRQLIPLVIYGIYGLVMFTNNDVVEWTTFFQLPTIHAISSPEQACDETQDDEPSDHRDDAD